MNGQGKDAEEKTWLFFLTPALQLRWSHHQSSQVQQKLADHKQTRGYGHMQAMIKLPALYSQTSLIGHQRERSKCPLYRGVRIIEVGNV